MLKELSMPFLVVLGQPSVTWCPLSTRDGAGQAAWHHSCLPCGSWASHWRNWCGPMTCGMELALALAGEEAGV